MTVKFINLKNFDKLAVISGEGKLPHLLFKEMNKIKVKTWAFHPQNISVKTPKKMTKIVFNLLDIEGLFFDLKKKKIKNVVFAGKITRNITNNLNPEVKNNIFTNEVHPFLKQTDDKLLRKIGKIFENHGFIINGVKLLYFNNNSKQTLTSFKFTSLL